MQKGKKVSVRYTLPISFMVDAEEQKKAKKEWKKQKKNKDHNPNVIDY